MYAVRQPYQIYTDKSGNPLENGKLYFGVANQNPEVYPQTVYWDVAGTIPASQPIRTIGGYPVYNGTPAIVYCNSFYSVTARSQNDVFQYTFPDSSVYDTPTTVAGSNVFSGKNLLLNSNFVINQRQYVSGTNVIAAGIFTVDGWAVMAGGQNVTFSPSGTGPDNAAIAPAGGLQQGIEGYAIGGGVYTISWEGTAGCQINGTNVTNGQNITLPANTAAYVRFLGGSVIRPQLELSPQKTQYDRRLFTTEILACFRYCYVAGDLFNIGGVAASPNQVMTRYRFPAEMYAAPTITILRNGTYNVSDDYTGDIAGSSLSILGSKVDRRCGGRVLLSGFTGLTTGRYYNTSLNQGDALIMFESVI